MARRSTKTIVIKADMGRKVDDAKFWAILRENGGLFAKTAFAIKKELGIDITRQSVRDRALNNPEELKDIHEQNIDVAESGLLTLMKSGPPTVRIKAIELYLRTQAKARGYVMKTEIDLNAKQSYDLSRLTDEQLATFLELQQKLIEPNTDSNNIE